jgi:cytochrome c oxidase subunit II
MDGLQSALNPAGPQASAIAAVTWMFFAVGLVVYVLVIGACAWAIFRRRTTADNASETDNRLTWLVAGAVSATVATVIVLSAVSVIAGRGLTTASGQRDVVTIDVIGHQWWWEFQYHGAMPSELVNSPNEMHVPVGLPVVIRAISRDVIHSFWAPNLHGKRDLIPGFETQMRLQVDTPGIYRGQCAEFCGHQHAHMAFQIVAEPADVFQSWLEQQRRAAAPPTTAEAQHGHDVFMGGTCATCHTIRGTSAGSRIGPELTHLASRRRIAAGTLDLTRDHLARWIVDSQSIKPGNRMPPNPLPADDLQALLTYLETLR